jgi:hypothetical protein
MTLRNPAVLAAALMLGAPDIVMQGPPYGKQPGPSISRKERDRRKSKKKAAKKSRRRNQP